MKAKVIFKSGTTLLVEYSIFTKTPTHYCLKLISGETLIYTTDEVVEVQVLDSHMNESQLEVLND